MIVGKLVFLFTVTGNEKRDVLHELKKILTGAGA
jgi:hypothetical protein